METKNKKTLDEIISIAPEESEKEKTDPDTIDLEEPARNWWKISAATLVTLLLVAGLGYAGYQVYLANQEEDIDQIEQPVDVNQSEQEKTITKVFVDATAGLNLRAEASANSEVVTLLPDKSELTLISDEGDWYKVKYQDKEGFVVAEFTSKVLMPSVSPETE